MEIGMKSGDRFYLDIHGDDSTRLTVCCLIETPTGRRSIAIDHLTTTLTPRQSAQLGTWLIRAAEWMDAGNPT
jgi:hypothetical protein